MRIEKFSMALIVLIFSNAVSAADFTFNVPVRIENSVIWRIHVTCYVFENEIGSGGRSLDGAWRPVGDARTSIDITNGEFDGVVTVEVDADPGAFPSLARSYHCNMSASWPYDPEQGFTSGGGGFFASPDNFESVYEDRAGRTLTTMENEVHGSIPQQ